MSALAFIGHLYVDFACATFGLLVWKTNMHPLGALVAALVWPLTFLAALALGRINTR